VSTLLTAIEGGYRGLGVRSIAAHVGIWGLGWGCVRHGRT
jgi:hypothetical protein